MQRQTLNYTAPVSSRTGLLDFREISCWTDRP